MNVLDDAVANKNAIAEISLSDSVNTSLKDARCGMVKDVYIIKAINDEGRDVYVGQFFFHSDESKVIARRLAERMTYLINMGAV